MTVKGQGWTNESEMAKRIAELEQQLRVRGERLMSIKEIVTGERHPNWTDDAHTYVSRGKIADLCEFDDNGKVNDAN